MNHDERLNCFGQGDQIGIRVEQGGLINPCAIAGCPRTRQTILDWKLAGSNRSWAFCPLWALGQGNGFLEHISTLPGAQVDRTLICPIGTLDLLKRNSDGGSWRLFVSMFPD